MNIHPWRWLPHMSSLFLATALTSCGGGFAGIDGSGSKPATQVSVSAPINGFGSVILNGVHYNTENTKVYVKGELTSEQALDVGDFVTMVGYITDDNNGVAVEIHYQPKVSATIDWLDANTQQLGLLKQKVQIDSNTIFTGEIYPKNFFGLKLGTSISVSGATDANGVVRATRVAVVDSPKIEISGRINTIDFQTTLLEVNGLKVDFSGIGSTEHLIVGKNSYITGVLNDDVLMASAIDMSMDIAKLSPIDNNQLQGFIGQIIDSNHFTLEGIMVTHDADTHFKNGSADNIYRNRKIRIQGKVRGQTIEADAIEFLENATLQLYGEIEDVVPANKEGNVLGYIKVQGQTYTLLRNTSLQKSRERYFSFKDFRVGDSVSVSAFTDTTQMVATKITVQTESRDFSEFAIEGSVHNINLEQNQFYVFSTRVILDENTKYLCRKDITDCTALALEEGSHAEIQGKMTSTGFLARSIHLQGKLGERKERQFGESDSLRKSKMARKRSP